MSAQIKEKLVKYTGNKRRSKVITLLTIELYGWEQIPNCFKFTLLVTLCGQYNVLRAIIFFYCSYNVSTSWRLTNMDSRLGYFLCDIYCRSLLTSKNHLNPQTWSRNCMGNKFSTFGSNDCDLQLFVDPWDHQLHST